MNIALVPDLKVGDPLELRVHVVEHPLPISQLKAS